ncbi:MAG: amidohydrolase, partial [Deltaproteobacteria bacterium]|nr:amidohydrolase [Deltaproteobacteria bacterium]
MLIDAHTHVFPPAMQQNRGGLVSRDPGFRCIYQNEKAKMVQVDEIVTMLDRENIDRAVIFGFPWQDLELCKRGNDYVLES